MDTVIEVVACGKNGDQNTYSTMRLKYVFEIDII